MHKWFVAGLALMHSMAQARSVAMPVEDEIYYVECLQVRPGQCRCTSKDVSFLIDEAKKHGYIEFFNDDGVSRLKFDEGRSLLPKRLGFPVIIGPMGYVLVEGHHRFLAAYQLGSKTVPVWVADDFSRLSFQEFWQQAEAAGYVYLKGVGGHYQQPPERFEDLEDDPNRWLAVLLARKVPANGDFSRSHGAEYPVWVRFENDPFVELRVGDVLREAGIVFDYTGNQAIPVELAERCRQVLLQSAPEGIWVIPERLHYSEIHS